MEEQPELKILFFPEGIDPDGEQEEGQAGQAQPPRLAVTGLPVRRQKDGEAGHPLLGSGRMVEVHGAFTQTTDKNGGVIIQPGSEGVNVFTTSSQLPFSCSERFKILRHDDDGLGGAVKSRKL